MLPRSSEEIENISERPRPTVFEGKFNAVIRASGFLICPPFDTGRYVLFPFHFFQKIIYSTSYRKAPVTGTLHTIL
jgi:hypothetical protein